MEDLAFSQNCITLNKEVGFEPKNKAIPNKLSLGLLSPSESIKFIGFSLLHIHFYILFHLIINRMKKCEFKIL
jgi:hypothetical protein